MATRLLLAAAMLLVGFGAGAGAFSVMAGHDEPDVIHACVNNETGAVRIVESPDQCDTEPQRESRSRRSSTQTAPERLLEWNQQGPTGPVGPQGPPGEAADLPAASCPEGEMVNGFDENGELLCDPVAASVAPDQSCAVGDVVTGFDANGDLICEDVDNLTLRDCSNIPIIPGADLSNCDLRGADLSFAVLFNADLSDANLSDADLSFADLSLADLAGADLTGATLDDVLWSDTTCPDGTNSFASDGDGLTCLNNLDT